VLIIIGLTIIVSSIRQYAESSKFAPLTSTKVPPLVGPLVGYIYDNVEYVLYVYLTVSFLYVTPSKTNIMSTTSGIVTVGALATIKPSEILTISVAGTLLTPKYRSKGF
jgi:hypothetical protein